MNKCHNKIIKVKNIIILLIKYDKLIVIVILIYIVIFLFYLMKLYD